MGDAAIGQIVGAMVVSLVGSLHRTKYSLLIFGVAYSSGVIFAALVW